MRRMVVALTVALMALVVLLPGCGGGKKQDKGADAPRLELMKFALAYHEFADQNRKGPARLDDLQKKRSEFPAAAKLIQDGGFVVIWNAVLFPNSDENDKHVLGYEKAVPDKGGLVLLGGGTIQQMTAEEFKKTPKLPTRQ